MFRNRVGWTAKEIVPLPCPGWYVTMRLLGSGCFLPRSAASYRAVGTWAPAFPRETGDPSPVQRISSPAIPHPRAIVLPLACALLVAAVSSCPRPCCPARSRLGGKHLVLSAGAGASCRSIRSIRILSPGGGLPVASRLPSIHSRRSRTHTQAGHWEHRSGGPPLSSTSFPLASFRIVLRLHKFHSSPMSYLVAYHQKYAGAHGCSPAPGRPPDDPDARTARDFVPGRSGGCAGRPGGFAGGRSGARWWDGGQGGP